MNEVLHERCELLVKNQSEIRQAFRSEEELMSIVAGFLFASAGIEADTDKLKECRKVLQKRTGFISLLRKEVELVLLSKMAQAEDPDHYMFDFLEVYKKLQKEDFKENNFTALAAVLILDFQLQGEADSIASKSKALVKQMNSAHPFLTSTEDTSFVVFLSLTDKSIESTLSDLEEGYTYLKKTCKVKATSNAIYELCEVLAITYGDMIEKCDKAMRFFNAFANHKAGYEITNGFSSLGALIDLDVDPDAFVEDVIEAEAYLKRQKVFGDNEKVSKTKRLMYATLLLADIYGARSETADNSVISSVFASIRAKKIANLVSITSSVLSSVIPAVLKLDDDDKSDSSGSKSTSADDAKSDGGIDTVEPTESKKSK